MKTKQITFNHPDGSTYQGTWKNGKQDGYGICKEDNFTYEGEWKNGLPHGEGVLTDEEDGTIFEGDFFEGISADGILELDDGSMYGGGFNEKGELHGTGILINQDGDRLKGTFENNEMRGVFEITEEDGYYSIGEYKNNQRHGVWYEEDPDGSKWDVKYEDGEVVESRERKIELVPDK
mgnify:FL=1